MKRSPFSIFGAPTLQPALATASLQPVYSEPTGSRLVLFAEGDSSEKETVRVQRRRRTTSPGPEGRERADAPERERSSSGGGSAPPPSGPGRPTGGGRQPSSGRSGGGKRLSLPALGILLLLVLCIGPFVLRQMGQDDSSQPATTPVQQEAAPVAVEAPPPATEQPAAANLTMAPAAGSADTMATDEPTWLIMLYQDADDKVLEKDIFVDMNEAERAGSGGNVHIVSQLDRYRTGYSGGGDWSSTKRFYVTKDDDLESTGSQQVADLGEANMADGDTLVDFVTWAMESYPADKHVLIMADHGMGWPGGWSDPTATGRGDASIPLSQNLGDILFLHELDAALGEIRTRTGLEKFELIGMDACLMGQVEVYSALAPHARYAVASQETEPALGWAYTSFLNDLRDNPNISGADLGRLIVDSYIQDDQRIVDDQARADFVGGGRGGFLDLLNAPSADQIARQLEENVTLAAIDLSTFPQLMESVDDFVLALQQVNQKPVVQARSYAQSFTSIFGNQVPPSYIDLGSFVQLLAHKAGDANVTQAANRVVQEIGTTVLAEKHGPSKPGASGLSVYFPNSQLYANPSSGYTSYGAIARRFAEESLWDEFLAFHYTGRPFEANEQVIAVPQRSADVRGPGAGDVTVSPITLSSDTAAPGRPVLLSTDIGGDNVGYVKLFAGFYDDAANSVYIADQDYLESAETQELDGVYYPVWPGDDFTMEFEWEPVVFAIDNGGERAVAMFAPHTYGASFEDAIYTVDGIYTYADDNESRNARLYFRNGVLEQVFGFSGESGAGAPREIVPEPGDTFTVLDQWMDLDQSGGAAQMSTEEGDTLTFGDQPFTYQDLDAAAGDYIVGFIVEDLDGNPHPVYERVTVE